MKEAEDQAPVMPPRDFFKAPKESKIVEEAKAIAESEKRGIIDEVRLRKQEDWSYLAHKVVGAEGD
jgi:hypothetical protein